MGLYKSPVRVVRDGRLVAFAGEVMSDEEAAFRGLLAEEVEEPEQLEEAEETDLSAMTVSELAALCDERGVKHAKKATKPELLALLEG